MREAFGAKFDIGDGYLNTASIGVPPVQVAEELVDAVRAWSTGAAAPPDFDGQVATARRAFAGLAGVAERDVAIGASVSQLVALVAAGLPEASSVLCAEGEFTSVSFPFAARAGRGVRVHEVPQAELPGSLAGHDLVAVSVVQSSDGRLLDVDALRAAAARTSTRVLLDVTQAAGWLPLHLDWADFVVGASYKWLLAPRGAAWLAVRPDALDAVVPAAANWYAGEDPWQSIYGLPLRLASGARGLDLSPVWFSQVGAAVTLPWLAGLDREAVRAHCAGLADRLRTELGLPPSGSAIVTLERPGAAEALRAAGVRTSLRAGRPRLSFHLYNTDADVRMVLDALRRGR